MKAACDGVIAFAGVLAGEDERTEALKKDVNDQACLAVSRADWYKAWGAHYLRSLSRAHLLQQCHNFKDKSVDFYGGEDFRHWRDEAEDTFTSLPPPAEDVLEDVETVMAFTSMSQAECSRALQAARGNIEQAVNFLMDGGIPTQAALRPQPAYTPASAAPRPQPSPPAMSRYFDAYGG